MPPQPLTSSSLSSLNDSVQRISLGASTWNREKAKQKIEGRPSLLPHFNRGELKGVDCVTTKKGSESRAGLLRKRRYPTIPGLHTYSQSWDVNVVPKSDIDNAILADCLSSHFLFHSLSEADIEYLTQILKPVTYRNHEIVIQQGDPPGYFYILSSGDILITYSNGKSVKSENSTDKYVVFGELSLLTSTPQEATVKATSDCRLFRLEQRDFFRIVQPSLSSSKDTKDERLGWLRRALPEDLVASLDDDDIATNKLLSGMRVYSFIKGETLYKKGDILHSFVGIALGQVVLRQVSLGGRDYPDIYLGPNDPECSFGWLTMSEDEALAGTIMATMDGVAFVIPKHIFLNAFGGGNCGMTTLRHIVEKRSARIQLANVSIFQDSELDFVQLNGLLDLMHHCEYGDEEVVIDRAEKVEPAIYFVREGRVTLEIKSQEPQTMNAGGYFGEKTMLLDQNKDGETHHKKRRSPMKAVAHSPKTRIDILYLEECRKVLDTTRLGLGHADKENDTYEDCLKWSKLKLHSLLGSGSFGQVWLATTPDDSPIEGEENPLPVDGSSQTPKAVAVKIQAKYQLIQSPEQVDRLIAERNILSCLMSPFLIRLYCAFQDEHRLYMVTPVEQGGELRSLIPENGLSEEAAKFYAAGILEGLTYMHRKHILHRDLKTANVLIDQKGYPVIIDMGFAKYVTEKSYTFCGTPMYTAPEVIQNKGHDKSCDHWSWAVLVYRMVTGSYPFDGKEELELFKAICKGQMEINGMTSFEFRTLIVSVLYPDPTKRLGSKINGWRDIFAAPWFSTANLTDIRKQCMAAPWVPRIATPLDDSRFVHDPNDDEDHFSRDLPTLSTEQQLAFQHFGPDLSESVTISPPSD